MGMCVGGEQASVVFLPCEVEEQVPWNSHWIQMSTGLIKQQDPGLAENRSGQAHQLLVAVAQDKTPIHKDKVKLSRKLFDHRSESNLQKRQRENTVLRKGGSHATRLKTLERMTI